MLMQADLEQLEVNEVYEMMLGEAAKRLGLTMTFRYGGAYVYFESKAGHVVPYIGGHFSFNKMVACTIATDKAWCYDRLVKQGIPAIPHYFLSDDLIVEYMENGLPNDMVLKPMKGLGGKHVYFVRTKQDLLHAVKNLQGCGTISASPFESYEVEYRITVLDGEVIMAYGKTKTAELQNNLSCGAQVTELPVALLDSVSSFAIDAVSAMNLRAANIDIFVTAEGTFKIMEVNSSVALKRVAKASPAYYEACLNAYVTLISKALAEQVAMDSK